MDEHERIFNEAIKMNMPSVFVAITFRNKEGIEKKRSRVAVFMSNESATEYYEFKKEQLDEEMVDET